MKPCSKKALICAIIVAFIPSFCGFSCAAEYQVKKEIFDIALGVERMEGNTAFEIGFPVTDPDGTRHGGFFPFSRLEWPLDMWMARIDAGLNLGESWRVNGVLKKNISDPTGNMRDSDWLTESDPGRLDIFSESHISKFAALVFDVDLEWNFLKRQSWLLFAGLGYQHQKFSYEAELLRQYSPSGMPDCDAFGDGRVAITYDITYSLPYLKIL